MPAEGVPPVVSLRPAVSRTAGTGQLPLPLLQDEICACRKCVDAGFLTEARPLTAGESGADVLVIGQAPSRTDHETGQFYSGPAGQKLRAWLVSAGFSESDFGTRIYAAAITKCFPGRLPGSSKDRVPSRAEQTLCRPWLDAEIAAIDPKLVILFGGLAIKTFLSTAPLETLIGHSYAQAGRLWLPLPHSSGASIWLNLSENRQRLEEALIHLHEIRVQRLQ